MKTHKSTDYQIDDSFIDDVKNKMNINIRGDGVKHFGSKGKYYGFGAVAKYKIVNNSSIGIFAQKKCKFFMQV